MSDRSQEWLFTKAQIYIERAIKSDRNSSLFPFRSSLALELICRATLSKIHPVLIADPREGDNILYAFGCSINNPKTIAAKTVLSRLKKLIPGFNWEMLKFCEDFINMRNEELHSWTPIFEEFDTNKWLIKFYKTIKILLNFQGKSLQDFIGFEESETAEEMIKEYDDSIKKSLFEYISEQSKAYEVLSEQQKEIAVKEGQWEIAIKNISRNITYKNVQCPCCKEIGLISGKIISKWDPTINWDTIIINNNILPTKFNCFVCNTEIIGNSKLSIINLWGQFAKQEEIDPIEFHEIDISNWYEDFDYGND